MGIATDGHRPAGADRTTVGGAAAARPAATTARHRPTPATARAALGALVRAYVLLCAVLVPVGLALTRPSFTAPLRSADESISAAAASARTPWWDTVTAVVTGSLDTIGAVTTAAVLSAVLYAVWRNRTWALLPLGLALEVSVFLTVSALVGRDRPAVVKLGAEPSTNSFPSGHAAAAAVIWLGLALALREQGAPRPLRRVASGLAVAVPVAVAAGRVYRGMHHASDVLVGLLLGAAVAVAVLRMLRSLPMEETSPAAPTPDGHRSEVRPR